MNNKRQKKCHYNLRTINYSINYYIKIHSIFAKTVRRTLYHNSARSGHMLFKEIMTTLSKARFHDMGRIVEREEDRKKAKAC